jgi:hypothetical protein
MSKGGSRIGAGRPRVGSSPVVPVYNEINQSPVTVDITVKGLSTAQAYILISGYSPRQQTIARIKPKPRRFDARDRA